MKGIKYFIFIVSLLAFSSVSAQIIVTIAGNGTAGYGGDGGAAVAGMLNSPRGIAVNSKGDVFVADHFNNRVRKVSVSGIITTIAGTGVAGYNGSAIPAAMAQLNGPSGVAIDRWGNIYLSEEYENRIRKIDTFGIISTIVGDSTGIGGYTGDGGPSTAAKVNNPDEMTTDTAGNLYFAEISNSVIRKINTAGVITTVAGNGIPSLYGDGGPATAASLADPISTAVDRAGNVYIADNNNHRIRKVNTTGIITTIAGNGVNTVSGDGGPATAATVNGSVVAVDNSGNIYLCEAHAGVIRKIDVAGIITTIAGGGVSTTLGDGGPATSAYFNQPIGMAINAAGDIYVADCSNNRIRYIKSTVAIQNIASNIADLQVFPNPAHGNLTLQVVSDIRESAKVTIINSAGIQIKEIQAMTNEPVNIPANMLPGCYLIMATTAGQTWHKTIVIQ